MALACRLVPNAPVTEYALVHTEEIIPVGIPKLYEECYPALDLPYEAGWAPSNQSKEFESANRGLEPSTAVMTDVETLGRAANRGLKGIAKNLEGKGCRNKFEPIPEDIDFESASSDEVILKNEEGLNAAKLRCEFDPDEDEESRHDIPVKSDNKDCLLYTSDAADE